MAETNVLNSALLSKFVGLDSFIRDIERAARSNRDPAGGFPPYNIVKEGEDDFIVELAVAGFEPSEIDVETRDGKLVVSGEHAEGNIRPDEKLLYKGISARSFSREFALGQYVEVKGASLANGILSIVLRREIPDARKPRKIEIGGAAREVAIAE